MQVKPREQRKFISQGGMIGLEVANKIFWKRFATGKQSYLLRYLSNQRLLHNGGQKFFVN